MTLTELTDRFPDEATAKAHLFNLRWLVGKGSYESTWYACHRIRAAMKDEHFRRLTGVVEIDETYIGGEDKNRHKNKKRGTGMTAGAKVPVIGAIARKGNVVCQTLERVTGG